MTNLPGVLTYETTTGLADIAAFYQTQIPTLGWAPGNEPTFTDTSMIVDFTQGTVTLTVIATIDNGVTTVRIAMTS